MTWTTSYFATPSRRGFRSLLIAFAMVASLLPFALADAVQAVEPDDLVISEIMYNPASSEDNWEWVEVSNIGVGDADLAGYVIDDINSVAHSAANIAGGTIPAGTSAVLFNADDVTAADFEAAWGTGINLIPVSRWGAMALNNGGDQVGLWDSFASYSGDNTTHANTVETVPYSSGGNGPSIYLIDLAADVANPANWAVSGVGVVTPTFTGYQSIPLGGNSGGDIGSPGPTPPVLPPAELVISEIMYNPASAEDNWEWVEVSNTGAGDADLSGYVIDDNNNVAHGSTNIAGGSIPAGTSAVLFNVDDISAGEFTSAWGSGINLIPVTNWTAMGLNNGGDRVGLWRSFADYSGDNVNHANTIEDVLYDDSGDWPADDGSASIYLTDLASNNNDGTNWALSSVGGVTPTFTGYQSIEQAGNSGLDIGSPGPTPPVEELGILINEVDSDDTSGDDEEFIEIFDGGDGDTALDGLAVVLFNGSDDASYGAIDLDTYSTNADGYFVICAASSALPAGTCDLDGGSFIEFGSIQNGADAVALYQADAADFPSDTAVTTEGLVDALVYDTNDGDDAGLLPLLNSGQPQVNEGGRGAKDTHSNQRCPNGSGGARSTDTYNQFDPTPGSENTCIYFIHEIQGAGADAAITGPVKVQGIVTSLFEDDDEVEGFFIQEEDADADANPLTSEGLFVFCGNCPSGPISGDLVTVTGSASDFFAMTEISAFGSEAVVIESSGNPLPTETEVLLPATNGTNQETTFEAYEGMIVEFTDTLIVSEYFQLNRFGQVVLTVDERPFQFTHSNAPDAAGNAAFLADLATRRIILDDHNNDNNDAIFGPGADEPYYYPGGFSVANFFRGGDSISGLTGVLDWSFAGGSNTDAWRVRPVEGEDYSFTAQNPRQAEPDDVGGTFTVASFNVLNYFATIDETSSTSSGPCGPDGDLDCRGADSVDERDRQRDKIVSALAVIDADVVGLIELENDGNDASIDQLVAGLNSAVGAGTYDYIPTGFIGSDAIKVGLIYKPATATPVGDFAILDDSVDPTFIEDENRPVLIQTFEGVATAERFTVAVNHLKSKGSPCTALGDPDLGDGAGNCNLTRESAAIALANYLATDPTQSLDPDFLIIGDLNSYAMEDPIVALENAGYTDLLESAGPGAYTFVFDGQLGYLDYAMANEALLGQVTGVTAWNINADEVNVLDYNDDVTTTGEASFERESSALDIYDPDPYRSSDHDPVIAGVAFTTPKAKKQAAIGELEGLLGEGTRSDDRLLQRAIRDLERSLADELWLSDILLDLDRGNLVFTRERQAVSFVLELSDAVREDAMAIIPYLVAADRQLAVKAIGVAIDSGGDVTAAIRFLALGDDKAAAGAYEMAITRYKQAWDEAVFTTLP